MKIFNPAIYFVFSLIACNNSIKYPDGAYNYPKHVADKDTNFYYYPVKDVMSKQDSLWYSSTYLAFKEYDEPNLSLKPVGQDVFRLQYSAALGGFYIITLTKNSIQIKKEVYNDERLFDENRLSPDEQKIYRLITYYYPYNNENLSERKKRFIDSLKIANPKLLQPEYFLLLTKKAFKPFDPKKVYKDTTIRITDKDFNHLVETINKSGYWKMPCVFNCRDYSTDGYGCILEANTKSKYNFVQVFSCGDSLTEQKESFLKAAQEIINYAHLENEFFLWRDNNITDTTSSSIVVQDVQLEDIKEPLTKHKSSRHNSPHKDSTAQVSDTTKMP